MYNKISSYLKGAESTAIKQANKMYQDVTKFFYANPNPSDDLFHSWCEKMGYNPHEAESQAYKLATITAKFLNEGRSIEEGLTKDDVDQKELALGIKVELEHIKDVRVAEKIALDHLAEIDDYYTRLIEMEKEAE